MTEPINLADPSFEPTDEQLAGLWARAMVDVRISRERAMAKLRADIASAQAEALRELERQIAQLSGT